MTDHQQYRSGLPDPVHDAAFYDGVPMRRLLAWVADAIAIVLISVLITLAFGIMTFGFGFFLGGFIFMIVSFLYRAGTIATSSATPGMMLMGIEFRTAEGQKFELPQAVIHTLVYFVVAATVLGQIISIFLIATTPYGRSISDFVLGSTAINKALE